MFNLSSDRTLSRPDMPYIMALGGAEEGVLGVFNENDVECAKWLIENTDLPIHADYNGCALTMAFSVNLEGVRTQYKGAHYLFLTSWNTLHNKMVVGSSPAQRVFTPVPELDNAIEVYRRGDAVVYSIAEK